MGKIEIVVKENEEEILPFISINGEREDTSLIVRLAGNNARVFIAGIFLGSEQNASVFNTTVIHQNTNTYSRTDLRGVFLNHASFTNDAMIRIEKGSKQADGFFTSKILLFDDAKGRSVPSLEIDENEVKAGHASTIGRPNAEQLFYMQSRGLSQKDAERLLIAGFFGPLYKYFSTLQQKLVQKEVHKIL